MQRSLSLEAGRSIGAKEVMEEPTTLPGGRLMKADEFYEPEPAIIPRKEEEPEPTPTVKSRSDPEQDIEFARRVAREQLRVTVQAKIDWFMDRGKWEDAVSYIWEVLHQEGVNSKLSEICHFHLGEILLTHGKVREAANLLQKGVEEARCRTSRIFDLLITIFGPEHYDNTEKVATYRELRKRAIKIEGFFE